MDECIAITKFWGWYIHPQRDYMPIPQMAFWECLNGTYSPIDFSKRK